jgi:hypothetical protein
VSPCEYPQYRSAHRTYLEYPLLAPRWDAIGPLVPVRAEPPLGSPLPHLRRDSACPSYICCTRTGLTPPPSAPGLGAALSGTCRAASVMLNVVWRV